VNYPADKLRQAPNAVRWYCVPETWIKLFVDKSVVTGSYRFFYDLLIYGVIALNILFWLQLLSLLLNSMKYLQCFFLMNSFYLM
jgi:hypothetical protein